jgi:hypothetical protein
MTHKLIRGPWEVKDIGMSWYIKNELTGKTVKIGPVRMKGKNYHDVAQEEAQRRNINHFVREWKRTDLGALLHMGCKVEFPGGFCLQMKDRRVIPNGEDFTSDQVLCCWVIDQQAIGVSNMAEAFTHYIKQEMRGK